MPVLGQPFDADGGVAIKLYYAGMILLPRAHAQGVK